MRFHAEVKVSDWKLIGVISGMFCVLFYFSTPCEADITDDLKPVAGYVVMAGENECIIDLDAEHGIAVGDVFSVIGPGEELVHPITQKIIGKLEEVKGVLKVIRISDGYSFARPLRESAAIKRGDPIRRFASLKAAFWDYSDNNRPLFDRLQNELSSLKWQDYNAAQVKRPPQPSSTARHNNDLFFIVYNNVLEVRDGQYGLIRKYPLGEFAPAAEEEKTPAAGDGPAAVQKKHISSVAQYDYEKKTPPVIDYGSADAIAQLLDNTVMADLLQHDGQRILAATDGKKISIFNLDKQLEPRAETKPQGYGQVLAVEWWQPNAAGPLYLAVLAWVDDKIDTTVFTLENNRLEPVVSGLDTILGSFDLDQDGRPETLLSQKFEADDFFGRRIKEMYWHDSQLKQRNVTVQLPPKFTVIGGQLADLTGDGELEAAYVRNGTLWVYSGKQKLYASPKQMGGSLSVLTYKVDPAPLDYRTTSVFFEVAPVAVDLDDDGRRELLAVSSDQSSVKAPGIMTTIDQSRIMIFNYENGAFVKGTVGEPVEAAIQGLDVVGRHVFFVATDAGSLLDREGGSRLRTLVLRN
jgi:hypothetical protein